MVSRMRPAAPAMAAMTERDEYTFCQTEVLCVRRPVCRSQRSMMKATSKDTTVTEAMAMKTGLKPEEPISRTR